MPEFKYAYLKTTNITRDTIYPPFLNIIFKDSHFQIRFAHVSVPVESLYFDKKKWGKSGRSH